MDPSISDSLINQTAEDKAALVKKIDAIFEIGDQRLWPIRKVAFESILHMIGEQGHVWDAQYRRFIPERRPYDWVPIPEVNLVLPQVEIAYAQFMKTYPEAVVVPNRNDEEQRQGARAADMIRRGKDWEDEIEAKVSRAVMHMIVSGDHFAWTYIGANFVKTLQVPKVRMQPAVLDENGEPVFEDQIATHPIPPAIQDGQFVKQMVPRPLTNSDGSPAMEDIPMTDVQTEMCSVFEVVLDSDVEHFEDCRYIGSKRMKSLDWIGDTFGSKAEMAIQKVRKRPSQSGLNWQFLDLMSRSGTLGTGYGMGSHNPMDNGAVVKTLIRRPTARLPKGEIIMTCETEVLYRSENPWRFTDAPGQLGVTQFGYAPILGTPWHFGLPKNILNLNRRIRGIHAGLAHQRKREGYGQWVMPKGATVMSDKMSGKPGLIISYDPIATRGNKPERINGAEPSQAVIFELQNCEALLEKIAGTNQVLAGEQPFAGMPGVSLSLLAEKAVARFVRALGAFERSLGKMSSERLMLLPLTRRWQDRQMVKMLGKDSEIWVEALSALDMRGNYDVRYELGNKRAGTGAAHRQNLLDLTATGYIDPNNPVNRQLAREEFGLSLFEDSVSPDYRLARWENTQMERGKAPIILPLEESTVHLQVHKADITRPEFFLLPPEIQQLKIDHLMETALRVQEAELRAAASGVGAPDGTGGGGGGGMGEDPSAGGAGEGGPGGPPPGGNTKSAGSAYQGGSDAPLNPGQQAGG